jgi:hypothetical protein
MKKQFAQALTRVTFLILTAMVIAVGSAQGQSLASRLTANIPFDFIVGNKTLTAGEYSIGRAQAASGDTVILISSADQSAHVLSLTNPVQTWKPKGKGTLVFHRYGDQYFLFQVWPAGANTGRVLPKSRREIQQLAQGPGKAKLVETVHLVVGL